MRQGRSQLDCHCGGRFRRIGITRIPAGRLTSSGQRYCHDIYEQHDPTPGVATFKCDKCGCTRTQKLRQPKPKIPIINFGL
jgi:hypothetical protein